MGLGFAAQAGTSLFCCPQPGRSSSVDRVYGLHVVVITIYRSLPTVDYLPSTIYRQDSHAQTRASFPEAEWHAANALCRHDNEFLK